MAGDSNQQTGQGPAVLEMLTGSIWFVGNKNPFSSEKTKHSFVFPSRSAQYGWTQVTCLQINSLTIKALMGWGGVLIFQWSFRRS